MALKSRKSRIQKRDEIAKPRRRSLLSRALRVETLETRQLLTGNFEFDSPGTDVELQVVGNAVQIIDQADGSVLAESEIAAIDERISITSRSFRADSLLELDGNSLQVYADTVDLTGAVIRTTDFDDAEDAGALLFEAREIDVLAGSTLDTQTTANSNHVAGRITLRAVDRTSDLNRFFQEAALPAVGDVRSSRLELANSTLLGTNITLIADGNTLSRYDDVAVYQDSIASGVIDALAQTPQIALSAVSPLSGQVKVHEATSSIVVTNSGITSSGWIDVDATAVADSSINALAINGTNQAFMGSVGFSSSTSSATINLLGNTSFDAASYIDIETSAVSTAETTTRSEGGSDVSSEELDVAFNLALALTNEVSTIDVGQGVTIESNGRVNLDAQGTVTNKAKADTAVFEDGKAAFSVAVGVDNAEVRANVAGTITSHDAGQVRKVTVPASAFDAATNQVQLTVPANAPLRVGERIRYGAAPAADTGLIDQAEYIVAEATQPEALGHGQVSQRVRLTRATSLPLDARQVPEDSEHTLAKLAVVEFPVSAISTESGTGDGRIELTLPAGVEQVTYLGPDTPEEDEPEPEGIPGLVQNDRYDVVRDGSNIKLRSIDTGVIVDFTAPADGPDHGFSYHESVVSFRPRQAVDHATGRITLPTGHGLQTGDLLVYGVDPERSIAREVGAFDAEGKPATKLGDVTLPDAPIQGLESSIAYRVIVDAHRPNEVRLARNLIHAELAKTSNLLPVNSGTFEFERLELQEGIRVNAHLDATNFAQAGVNLANSEQPWPSLVQGASNGRLDDIGQLGFRFIDQLRDGIRANGKQQAESETSTQSDTNLDLAGSLSVAVFEHLVQAEISDAAEQKTLGDLTIEATTEQALKLGVTAESTRNGLNETHDVEGRELALGVGVGVYSTTTHAIVDDSAKLDAAGNTNVHAGVSYPLLTQTEGNQHTVSTGLAGFNAWLSGDLDFTNLTNVYSRSLASGDGNDDSKVLAIGGGIALTFTNNDVLAQVASDAQINQDTGYFRPGRVVDVTASLDATMIEVGQMMSVNLSVPGIMEAIVKGVDKQHDVTTFLSELVNPLGVSGDKAFGGTLIVNTATGNVTAEIESGVTVSAEKLDVLADSDTYNFAGVQTGTGSTEIGFSAAIAASNLSSTTKAAIHEGAKINAPVLTIEANDELDRTTYAGAVLKGQQAGIGTSIGVNIVQQNVAAFMGREDATGATSAAQSYALGSARIAAQALGTVETIAISGAVQGLGGASADASSRQTGPLAITAPVVYNSVTTDVDAYLDGPQFAEVGSLEIAAHDGTSSKALVIGGSFAFQTAAGANAGKLNLAGAGAVAINHKHQTVDAAIHDSLVKGISDITVRATESSEVVADAGGLALAFGTGPNRGTALSFGTSVAINDVSGHTKAIVDNSTIDMQVSSGDLLVSATSIGGADDEPASRIRGLALGGAASGSTLPATATLGALGAAARNWVNRTVSAEITNDSDVQLAQGGIRVLAKDEGSIVADVGGLSLSGGVATKINGALGVGLAFNEVENATIARIENSDVSSDGAILVQANLPVDDSTAKPATIDALSVAGSLAVAGSQGLSASLAGAGSGSNNQIRNTITAEIIDSDVDSHAGSIDVQAHDATSIVATTVGAAIDAAFASGFSGVVSVGLSIARNEIDNTTLAKIDGGKVSTREDTGTQVNVHAADDGSISAVAVAASIAVGVSIAPAFSLSGGGAEASNIVLSDADTLIQNAEIATGTLSVTTDSSATIRSDVVGVTAGVAGSAAAGATASIGAAVANNFVGYLIDGNKEDARSHAQIFGSTIDASTIELISDSSQDIEATTFVGGFVVAATGGAAASAAGSGSRTSNRIGSSTFANLDAASAPAIDVSDQLRLHATDRSTVHANTTATTVAGFASGGAGGAFQIGLSLAENVLDNRVEALLSSVSFADPSSPPVVDLRAKQSEESVIDSNSVAVSVSGAAASGIAGGIGVAGASSVNTVSNKTLAAIRDSQVHASTVSVVADSQSRINATITNASIAAGLSLGSGGGLGLGINDARNVIGDSSSNRSQPELANQVIASIEGDTTIDASGSVSVLASNSDSITAAMNANAVSAAGSPGASGAVAGAGTAAYSTVASEVVAQITGHTESGTARASVNSGENVRVTAADESDVKTIVGSVTVSAVVGVYAGNASISVSKAESDVGNLVKSTIENADVVADQHIAVRAVEKSDIETFSFTTGVGATIAIGGNVTGGGAIAYGRMDSTVRSSVAGSKLAAGSSVAVTSQSTSEVDSDTKPLGVSVLGLAAGGSVPTAIIRPTVESLFSLTEIVANDFRVEADFYPIATADAAGFQIAFGATVGASDATVEVGGRVNAAVASGDKRVDVDRLTIDSAMIPRRLGGSSDIASSATANASSGGILLGTNSAYSESIDSSQVIARIGDLSSNIHVGTATLVRANSSNLQRTESDAYSGGVIGIGVPTAYIENSLTTKATLGTGVNIDGGSLSVVADGHSNALSDANAGTGGGAATSITQSKVDNRSVTEAGVGVSAGRPFAAGALNVDSLTIDADFLTQTNAVLGAVAGGLVSGQGGFVYNDVHSDVTATVGNQTTVTANTIDIDASQHVAKPDLGKAGNVDATTGGLVTGGGVGSHTTLTLNTVTNVGEGATLRATGGASAILALGSENSIRAADRMTVRAGGVGAQAHVDASIISDQMNARVSVAESAILESSGTIEIEATGTANVKIQSNSDAYGAVTIGSGFAEVALRPKNEIHVHENARLTAASDISLVAGVDTRDKANYQIESRMETFGGSLIPLEFIDGVASLLETNRIKIDSGSTVESGGNIDLLSERIGENSVAGIAKATNWVSGIDDLISGRTAVGGIEQTGGSSTTAAFGAVTVDGTVRTGTDRLRSLTITGVSLKDGGDPTSADAYVVNATGNIEFEQRLEVVRSALHDDLERALEQLAEYEDNNGTRNFYNSEVTRLREELRKQGLLSRPEPSAPELPTEQNAVVVSVQDVFAQAGAIRVSGDRLVGSGRIEAPGDAGISIVNESLAHIELSQIEIADSTGGVRLNATGVSEVGGGELAAINSAIATENLGRGLVSDLAFSSEPEYFASAEFSSVVGSASAPVPKISVANTAPTTTIDGTTYPWPNISVVSQQPNDTSVRNLNGEVELINHPSGAGSIIITGQIIAAELVTRAGSQGTATISLPGATSIYEVGGSEFASIHKQLYDTQTYPGIVPLDARPNSNPRFTDYLATVPTTPSISASRIFIEANFINVNGLIQSGQSDFRLSIGSEVASEIAAGVAAGKTGVQVLQAQPSTDFTISYDYDRERIIVSELAVSGGYVELTGNVANTRQGEIQVFAGYADIIIDNQTDYAIELNRIDAARRGEGTVIINDLGRGDGTTPESYHYIRKGDLIEQSRFLLNGSVSQELFELDDSVIYLPKPFLRYGWAVAQDRSVVEYRTYRSSSWLGAFDALARDGEEVDRTVYNGTPRVHGSGAYFFEPNNQVTKPRYSYAKKTFTNPSSDRDWRYLYGWEEWRGAFLWAVKDHFSRWKKTTKQLTLHSHSIRADRAIDIKFFGHDEGNLDIKSNGDVYIAGVLDNSSGKTSIAANDLTSVYQVGEQGLLRSRDIALSTNFFDTGEVGGQHFGTEAMPLNTDLQSLNFDFVSTDAPETILRGQRVRIEPGHSAGGEIEAVYRFLGLSEEIDFAAEDFTNTDNWEQVAQTAGVYGRLGYRNQSVHLNEVNGDLKLGYLSATSISAAADRNIVRRDDGGLSPFAELMSFTARTGSIGSAQLPLTLNGNVAAPAISASAAKDVYIASDFSNLGIDTIEAGGHVQIDATEAARVEDVNSDAVEDTRAIEEITQEVWIDLQLTEEFGASAKRQERVTALQAARSHDYHRYWQFRNTQEDPSVYQPEHRIELSQAEKDFYQDEDEITTLENARTQQYHSLHLSVGSLTSEYDEDYEYQASGDELSEIDESKVWTIDELTNLSQPYGVLGVSDTEFVIEHPNITAASVTINAAKGIGSVKNGSVVELKPDDADAPISLRDRALIAAAEPDDFVYLSRAPVFVPDVFFNPTGLQLPSREQFCQGECPKWSDYGMEVGQTIVIQSDNFAVEERLFEIVELEDDWMRVNADDVFPGKYESTNATIGVVIDPDLQDQATHLLIRRREDVDIKSPGPINATSEHNIFLGSEGDLQLERIEAGTDAYDARVEIRATGNLINAAEDTDQPNIVGSRVLLESALDSIGTSDLPLRLALTENHTLIARADDLLALVQDNANGSADLHVDELFSRREPIQIHATGSILDAFASSVANVQAPGITLTAGGSIGTTDNPLELNHTGTGTLTAVAQTDVVITETAGDLNLRQVLAQTGDVTLVADFSILDAVDVVDATDSDSTDSEQITGLPRTDVVGNSVTLTAKFGTVGTAGNEVDIDSNFAGSEANRGSVSSSSVGNTYITETTGDLYLGRIETDDETAFIVAPGGGIYSGLRIGEGNVLGGKLWVFAADDIGTPDMPLVSFATSLEGISTSGSISLEQRVPLEIGGVVGGAGEGEDSNFADGLAAGQDVTIRGERLRLSERIEADGDIELALRESFTMPAGTSIAGRGGRVTITAPELTVAKGAAIHSASRILMRAPAKPDGTGSDVSLEGSLLGGGIISISSSPQDDLIRANIEEFSGTQFIIAGNDGNDEIHGSRFRDYIYGGAGEDTIDGGLGCDIIQGREGFDTYLNVEACDNIGTLTASIDPVAEDAPRNTVVGTIGFEDLDEEDSVTYRLVDEDSPFGVRGNELVVLDPALLNRSSSYSIPVTIAADHAQGGTTTGTFGIRVNADNDTPFGIQLSGDSIPENESGAVIGDLTFSDHDIGDAHTFSVTDDRFEVSDGMLKLKSAESLNHELESQIELGITVTDLAGASTSANIGIDVLNRNDIPTQIELHDLALLENLEGMPIGTVDVMDEDAGAAYDIQVDHSQLEIVGNTVQLKAGEYLDRSQADQLTFSITVIDQSEPSIQLTQEFQFTIQPNEAVWQSTTNTLDVNQDGFIAPIDVLLIVNALNSEDVRDAIPLSNFAFPSTREFASLSPFYDVSGDKFLTPLDALLVINHLNRNAEGEHSGSFAGTPAVPDFAKDKDRRDEYFAEYQEFDTPQF